MANRRCFSVKKCQSVQFFNMSAGAQALYLAILGICDDDGIFEITFAKRVANRRKQDVDALLSNGYIVIIDRQLNLGYVVDWHEFNSLDAYHNTPSVFRQTLIDTFPNIENRLFSANKNAFGVQKDIIKQSKQKQSKGKKSKQTKTKNYESDFQIVWKEYPRQEGKQIALEYYSKSRESGATAQEILDGVISFSEKMKHEKRKPQYIKTGGNFFREELWKEDHTFLKPQGVVDDSNVLEGIL